MVVKYEFISLVADHIHWLFFSMYTAGNNKTVLSKRLKGLLEASFT